MLCYCSSRESTVYQPIPAANMLLSLLLEYFASQLRARGRRGTKNPSRLCQGEMCGHSNTPLPSLAMGDGAGSWRRMEENKAKRKGGSNFKRKEKLTLNYCFISGSMQVSDTFHPAPRDTMSAPKQPSKEKDLKGSCPKKEPSQDLDLQRSLLVKIKSPASYPAVSSPTSIPCRC